MRFFKESRVAKYFLSEGNYVYAEIKSPCIDLEELQELETDSNPLIVKNKGQKLILNISQVKTISRNARVLISKRRFTPKLEFVGIVSDNAISNLCAGVLAKNLSDNGLEIPFYKKMDEAFQKIENNKFSTRLVSA